jgi:hypothetical protein
VLQVICSSEYHDHSEKKAILTLTLRTFLISWKVERNSSKKVRFAGIVVLQRTAGELATSCAQVIFTRDMKNVIYGMPIPILEMM